MFETFSEMMNNPTRIETKEQVREYWHNRGYLCVIEEKSAARKCVLHLYLDKTYKKYRHVLGIDWINFIERANPRIKFKSKVHLFLPYSMCKKRYEN